MAYTLTFKEKGKRYIIGSARTKTPKFVMGTKKDIATLKREIERINGKKLKLGFYKF